MDDFRVEKSISLPPKRAKYPFWEMSVGDSFWSPNNVARSAAYGYGKAHGMAFVCRSEVKDGVTGVRIWRAG